MEEINKVELEIQVSMADATDEELDRTTRQLLSELRELDVESASLVRTEAAPEGSKGDPVVLGSISVDVLAAVLPSVIALIQVWVTRKQGRMVRFKSRGIDFEGSVEDLQKLLEKMDQGRRRK